MQAAVVVEGLGKAYGSVEAVREVSFEVSAGEVFALLGPNGAGKTTTIEILEGFRTKDRGRVSVLGLDPASPSSSRQFRERLGVVLQELAVEPFLTVRQVLTRNAGFFPNPRPVDEVIAAVGLAAKAEARVKTLSGGQQRRLDMGLGIIGNPELLFLDEPTTGFDPSARQDAWALVRTLCQRGTTVILTTHYMDEADALADRVGVLVDGRLVAQGTPDSLADRDRAEARIRFRLPPEADRADLPLISSPATTLSPDGTVEIRTSDDVAALAELTRWALAGRIPLIGLTVERATLEDTYLRLTGYRQARAVPNVAAAGQPS